MGDEDDGMGGRYRGTSSGRRRFRGIWAPSRRGELAFDMFVCSDENPSRVGEVKPDEVPEETICRSTELSKQEKVIEQVDSRIVVASPLPYDVKIEDVESFFGQHRKLLLCQITFGGGLRAGRKKSVAFTDTGPCYPLGDAAGYVTKCSGEGIYFAVKSERMCAEAVVEGSENGTRVINEADLRTYLKKFDQTYWPTYKVLDIHQNVFYCSDPAREAFLEMCADDYVQNMTFDCYLYKRVVPGNPLDDLKLAEKIIGSLVRENALRREMSKITL